MELVLFYHLECPDYVKKFDDPKNKNYLRRQLFNFLVTPYVHLKMIEKKLKEKPVPNMNSLKRSKYIPYPEELNASNKPYDASLFEEEDYLKSYSEGIAFTVKKAEAEAGGDDE